MDKDFKDKLNKIAQGLQEDTRNDELLNCEKLAAFYSDMAKSDIDNDSAECLIAAVDRLNDTVVPLFEYVFCNGSGVEWYRCIIFMFDENIDLTACRELIEEAVSKNVPCSVFDEILKTTSSQEEFELAVRSYVDLMSKGSDVISPEVQYKNGVCSGDDNNSCLNSPQSMPQSYDVGKEFIEHLKNENNRLSEKNDEYRSLIYNYQCKEKEYAEESLIARDELKQSINTVDSLKKENGRLKIALSISDKKLAKSRQMIDTLEDVNRNLSLSRVPVEVKEDPVIAEKISELEKSCLLLKERNTALETEAGESKNVISSLNRQIEDLNTVINDLNGEIEGLRKGVSVVSPVNASSLVPDDTDEYPFLDKSFDMAENETYPDYTPSNFTDDLFNDEVEEEYSQDDVIEISGKKSLIEKSCSLFSRLLSNHFEKKFNKKPQQEQNNLIFIKLMENGFSKDVMGLVKKTLEGDAAISRIELYRMITNKSPENEISNFCRSAA